MIQNRWNRTRRFSARYVFEESQCFGSSRCSTHIPSAHPPSKLRVSWLKGVFLSIRVSDPEEMLSKIESDESLLYVRPRGLTAATSGSKPFPGRWQYCSNASAHGGVDSRISRILGHISSLREYAWMPDSTMSVDNVLEEETIVISVNQVDAVPVPSNQGPFSNASRIVLCHRTSRMERNARCPDEGWW